ncbi:nuclear transport factor 2 family protein [Leifsonia sp. NPDC056665]|uniref:nuclear transport factor 2 family protein n=1 Tax=Leifsonia sp. NPDC056665 TaxID=3345901 RepID=UPI0036BFF534
MSKSDVIRATVEKYLGLAAQGTGAQIASLFSPNATVEDPAGSLVRRGAEDIAAFYDSLRADRRTIELLTLRVAANTAAFHFRVTTTSDALTIVVEPIDVMTFSQDGLITSMRAVWSNEDIVMTGIAARA